MDVLTSETCLAVNNELKKQVTSSWSLFIQKLTFVPRGLLQPCSLAGQMVVSCAVCVLLRALLPSYGLPHQTNLTNHKAPNVNMTLRCVIPAVCRKADGEANISHETQL